MSDGEKSDEEQQQELTANLSTCLKLRVHAKSLPWEAPTRLLVRRLHRRPSIEGDSFAGENGNYSTNVQSTVDHGTLVGL